LKGEEYFYLTLKPPCETIINAGAEHKENTLLHSEAPSEREVRENRSPSVSSDLDQRILGLIVSTEISRPR
jgi:hypothetical protein